MIKSLLTLTLILTGSMAFAAPGTGSEPADQAVAEYLQLRHQGQAHRAAFSAVRAKFHVSEDEFEKAANKMASEGYSRDEEREPSSSKK